MTPPDHDITLRGLQELIDEWITGPGRGYFSPLTNGLILAEETGEVTRILARLYGDQRAKEGERISTATMADELADVIWVAAALANQTGIDLTEAIHANLRKKLTRDSERFK